MSRKLVSVLAALALCLFVAGTALAHTPICVAYRNGDGTVTCEGGFSDGSSAAGVKMMVRTPAGKVLVKGVMDKNSEFTFNEPKEKFEVEFNAGPGHVVIIKQKDIK